MHVMSVYLSPSAVEDDDIRLTTVAIGEPTRQEVERAILSNFEDVDLGFDIRFTGTLTTSGDQVAYFYTLDPASEDNENPLFLEWYVNVSEI